MHDTRIQVHDALQAAAGVGRTLLPPRADDSHHSFRWSDAQRALVQDLVDGRFASGLRIHDLTLLLLDAAERVVAEYPLRNRTIDDGFRFYEERLGRTLQRPEEAVYEGALAPDEADLATLSRMYGQAAAILHRFDATPRLWPHHFDIAVLLGNLGVGFLAGDRSIDEPYWYVYNTPMPDPLPPLAVGEWFHGGHWTGAVLKGDPSVVTIEHFLDEAVAAVR
jgi:hypothetical protein